MKIVAALIKDDQVIDTYTLEIPLGTISRRAPRRPSRTFAPGIPTYHHGGDVMIAFRDDCAESCQGEHGGLARSKS